MKHLEMETIIAYVGIDAINEETKTLCAEVNRHLRECPECRQKTDAFQLIYDHLPEAVKKNGAETFFREEIPEKGMESDPKDNIHK